MKEMDRSQRVIFIDIAKGIGIVMMIMGHIGFSETFSHYIHAINMPLFFVISGYLYKGIDKSEFKVFIMKKSKKLLLPYLFFGILNILIALLIIKDFDVPNAFKHLFWINNTGLALSGAIWFLTSLFFSEITFTIILFLKRKIVTKILIIAIVLVGLLLPVRLPFSMNVAFMAVGLLYFGYHFKKYETKIDEWILLTRNKIWFILLVLLNITMIYINGFVNLRKHSYSNILMFYANAVIGALIILYCSKIILQLNFTMTNIMKKIIIEIGINSLAFMALNELFIKLINYFYTYNGENIIIKLLYKCVLLAIIILVIHIITFAISKTKFRFLIGK